MSGPDEQARGSRRLPAEAPEAGTGATPDTVLPAVRRSYTHPERQGRHRLTTWTEALRRAEIVAVGSALARRGLVRGREGNLSCRLDDGAVLLTPRGADKGRLSALGLVRCAPDAPPPPEASSEAKTHLAVYRRCPPVRAVVHAHPASVLALAALGRIPSPETLLEGRLILGRIEVLPTLPPGSQELADACAHAAALAPAVVLREHGALAVGEDLWQALDRIEVLELLAQLELERLAMGAQI